MDAQTPTYVLFSFTCSRVIFPLNITIQIYTADIIHTDGNDGNEWFNIVYKPFVSIVLRIKDLTVIYILITFLYIRILYLVNCLYNLLSFHHFHQFLYRKDWMIMNTTNIFFKKRNKHRSTYFSQLYFNIDFWFITDFCKWSKKIENIVSIFLCFHLILTVKNLIHVCYIKSNDFCFWYHLIIYTKIKVIYMSTKTTFYFEMCTCFFR